MQAAQGYADLAEQNAAFESGGSGGGDLISQTPEEDDDERNSSDDDFINDGPLTPQSGRVSAALL